MELHAFLVENRGRAVVKAGDQVGAGEGGQDRYRGVEQGGGEKEDVLDWFLTKGEVSSARPRSA